MPNIWSHMFGKSKSETRYTLADAAAWIKNAGHDYLLSSTRTRAGNEEPIGTDFAAYVANAYEKNGIVFACQVARMLVFSEARIQYQSMNAGRPGDLFDDAALAIFEEPWPGGTTGDLLNRAIQDADLAGNHYVYTPSSRGNAKRVRRWRPDWVDIILSGDPEKDANVDVIGHIYKPGGTSNAEKWIVAPIDGSNGVVAHWAPIPDPRATYRGMSWLTPVIREIEADGAATRHKAAFFNNAATPNLAVAFKETVTKEQFEGFMEVLNNKAGVEHAYETLYLGGGADVTVIGNDLQQMDFKVTQGAGETRIAAAARIHPVLVGLSEGMQGSSLNAGNYGVAKKAFANGTLRPLWRGLVGAYSVLVPRKPNARLWFDTRDIAYLQEDEKDKAEVQKIQSSTITQYVRDGFTAESAKLAVLEDNVGLLKHTNLFSVQLQKPGIDGDPSTEGKEEKNPKKTEDDDESDEDEADTKGK